MEQAVLQQFLDQKQFLDGAEAEKGAFSVSSTVRRWPSHGTQSIYNLISTKGFSTSAFIVIPFSFSLLPECRA